MAGDPQVLVVARDTGDRLQASRTNSLTQLATSLTGLHEGLDTFLGQYAEGQKKDAEAAARVAALKTSGKAFKDAVLSGEIEKTQNPWFIEQYEIQSAAVRANTQVSDLLSSSQSWPERNDQHAYTTRFNHELGALSSGYTGERQQQGFYAAAAPLRQQALAANTEFNVSRINAQHTQDTTALLSHNIQELYKANPKATTADYAKVIEASRKAFTATGGTDQQFNPLALQSMLGAASNSGAPEILTGIPEGLRNMATASGNSGEEIATAAYRIEQAENFRATAELRRQQAAIEQEGIKTEKQAWETYGLKLVTGDFNQREMIADLTAKGNSPQAIQWFLKKLASDVTANSTLFSAQVNLHSNNPEDAVKILDMYTRAQGQGYSPGLKADVTEAVRSGFIDIGDAKGILGSAHATSQHFESEGRADVREARAAAREDRRITIEQAHALKEGRDQTMNVVSDTLSRAGDTVLAKDPKARSYWGRRMNDAQGAYLAAHPDDYAGAERAANDVLNGYLKERLARRQVKTDKLQSPGGAAPNPRRGK